MDNAHSQPHNISSTNKRKRGRPRKDEVVGSLETTPQVSLPQKRHVGRPRKDGCLGPSNINSHRISVQQKRPVGRPRKVHLNPISDNGKIATGQSEPLNTTKTPPCHGTYNGQYAKFRPLLPRLPNQYPSLLNNSLIHTPSSSQLTRGIGHSCGDNSNGVTRPSSRHSKDTFVNLLSSFDHVSDSESQKFGEDDIINGDDDDDFNNSEDAIDNDTVMSLAHQGGVD